MRVLILTTQYLPHIGGSEIAIKNITDRLPGIQFDIISSKFKWFMPITGLVRGLRHRYDVINAFQASYAGGAGFFLKLARPSVPFIVTLQEGKDLDKQNSFIKFFRNVILRKADVITAISTYLVDYAKTIHPKAKIYLLPNGVDLEKFSNAPKGGVGKRIVSVSRRVPKNGLDILEKAMQYLPDYTLTIASNTPPDEIPTLLHSHDIFVRPSRSEGLGVAFLEAMAAGLPVIATPVGGIPDFLKDGETGLFCEVDNPESIARAVRKLEDEQVRERIIKNARKLVEECYDWDKLAQQYYEIIRRHSGI